MLQQLVVQHVRAHVPLHRGVGLVDELVGQAGPGVLVHRTKIVSAPPHPVRTASLDPRFTLSSFSRSSVMSHTEATIRRPDEGSGTALPPETQTARIPLRRDTEPVEDDPERGRIGFPCSISPEITTAVETVAQLAGGELGPLYIRRPIGQEAETEVGPKRRHGRADTRTQPVPHPLEGP